MQLQLDTAREFASATARLQRRFLPQTLCGPLRKLPTATRRSVQRKTRAVVDKASCLSSQTRTLTVVEPGRRRKKRRFFN